MRNRAMYNQSGYPDMTAYIALCNVMRAEKEKHKAQLEKQQPIQRKLKKRGGTAMTGKSFSFRGTDIRDIDPATLADHKDIKIDRSLPRDERMREFIRQTKGHPDCFIIDGVIVLSRFADTDETIEDRICAAIRNA